MTWPSINNNPENHSVRNLFLGLSRSRFLQHLLFWMISFRVLLEIFANSSEIQKIDFIYTLIFLLTLSVAVYINLYILIPEFFSNRKYFLYVLSVTGLLLLGSLFNQLTFNRLIDFIFPSYFFISYYSFTDILKFFLVFLIITSLLKLSKSWFILNETRQMLKEAEKEKVIAELKSLKSQVNPHFLFNSLNNIYSLVLKNSDKAPDAIIKLGDIMRYAIYRSREEWVSIAEEAGLLKDYIELQKIRTGKMSKISFSAEGLDQDVQIPPLLLLPLVENGFKHGVKGGGEAGFLEIHLGADRKFITFFMKNNKGKAEKIEKEEYRGLGLENVKRRLQLIYPGRHELDIQEDEKQYQLQLKIKLNEQD